MMVRLGSKIISFIQLLLVLIYIAFEELVWETIAKPLYLWLHSLRIVVRLERYVVRLHRGVLLGIFLALFAVVELLGVYAGLVAVGGHPFIAMMIYLAKIPVAAFTFWLFRTTKQKLFTYKWFKALYDRLMRLIERIKTSAVYQTSIIYLRQTKEYLNRLKRYCKTVCFSTKGRVFRRFTLLYSKIRDRWRKNEA